MHLYQPNRYQALTNKVKKIAVRSALTAENLFHPKADLSIEVLRSMRNFFFLMSETALGTAVHTTPLIAALRHAIPDACIVIGTSSISQSIYANNPFVDRIIKLPDPNRHPFQCAISIRNAKCFPSGSPWSIIATTGNSRTGTGLTSVLSGASLRVGFSVQSNLMHIPLHIDAALSQIANNLRVTNIFGYHSTHSEPNLFFTPDDLEKTNNLLNLSNPSNKPLVMIVTQPSGDQRTFWHNDRFLTVVKHLYVNGWHMLFTGTEQQSEAINSLLKSLPTSVLAATTNLAGKTSITELAALLSLCDAALSIDTGAMHVARAVGVPLVVLGPSWQLAHEWLPINLPNARVIRGNDINHVPENYMLDEILPSDVISNFDELITCYPPSIISRDARIKASLNTSPVRLT